MFELLRTLSNGNELGSYGDVTGDLARPLLGWTPVTEGPQADVYETADALRVVVDLPGYAADSVAIHFEKDVLSIEAERKREADAEKTLLIRERGFGKVRRTFALKVPVEAERIAAEYDRGVLTVTLPKRAEAKPHKIEITVK